MEWTLYVGPEPLTQALVGSNTFATQWFQMELEKESKSPLHQASLQMSSQWKQVPWDNGHPLMDQSWNDTRLLLSARPGSGGSPTARCACWYRLTPTRLKCNTCGELALGM